MIMTLRRCQAFAAVLQPEVCSVDMLHYCGRSHLFSSSVVFASCVRCASRVLLGQARSTVGTSPTLFGHGLIVAVGSWLPWQAMAVWLGFVCKDVASHEAGSFVRRISEHLAETKSFKCNASQAQKSQRQKDQDQGPEGHKRKGHGVPPLGTRQRDSSGGFRVFFVHGRASVRWLPGPQ